MATASEAQDKTVTGYPAQSSHVVAGYPAGTSYPYAAPPPPRPYSNTFQPFGVTQPRRAERTILCRLIIAMAVVLSIFSVIFFLTWLILKPHLPEFRVDSATVSPLNATQSELTATWNFTLFSRNPNSKLSIYYDRLQASVHYDDDLRIGTTTLPPFSLKKKNDTRLSFEVGAVSEYVGQEAVNEILDGKARGSVKFGVRLLAWVRFRSGFWRMRPHLLRVDCSPLEFGFGRNSVTGTLKGQSTACEVYL
ncbi:NDR1/HIN1-like protein 26 [Ziziphus jujuba]|uniref:NDR1/HIN1-like protein 26 n=2 Tax=Ziziphus jujuba TaxID=326968 RepID=A0A6P4B959_ZIZJJ|nr:NDR1/HIN1-like protein 26 [Ziziphus jujuba]XP_060668630.1 NDR1/HIN1-like protein 26 [Ziziphus jujuba]KAH7512241.1 hypothetical protein FEM48_Zijuj12G0069500 [Ziziphus jujuba var. spinosa]